LKPFASNIFAAILVVLAMVGVTHAESFGRNKVQYETFEWRTVQTPHFKFYYPAGFDELALRAGEVLEGALPQLVHDLGQRPIDEFPVIIYPTQADFQETNVIQSILGEGTGGFTESMKTRVVVPFNGSYEDFRHVLVHEVAHAMTFDKIYGRGPGKQFAASSVFNIPLWFAEGISEFESICWDVESDMYLRDAVLNGYVVPLSRLYGFLAYKQGASVVSYIATRYGRKKIGEIIGKGQVYIQPDEALKAALGRTQDEIYEEWLNFKRREYFPEFGFRSRPEDIAERITDHEKDGSYFNVMPSFSPDGQHVAFISNRKDYIDLYLVDILTKKKHQIAKAERTFSAQSFHPFRSRAGWSSDGKFLIYSRKAGGSDEIAVHNVHTGKIQRTFAFEGIREISSPIFLPGDTALVFSGLSGDRTDIYLHHFGRSGPVKITDDLYDDRFPTISPEGRYLAFSSDRPIFGDEPPDSSEEASGQMVSPEHSDLEFGRYNIWIYDFEADTLSPLTTDGEGNDSPVFSPEGGRIAYTSERNGVRNIWIAELGEDVIHRPYSDLLSGAFAPTWDPDGRKIVFSAFYNGGFDIFYMKELTSLDSLVPTPYMFHRDTLCPAEMIDDPDPRGRITGDLRRPKTDSSGKEKARDLYTPKKYKPEFSIDLVAGAVAYDTYYGFRGLTQIMFSDMLGDQQFYIATDLLDDLENSTVYALYANYGRRVNFAVMGYHYKNYFWRSYSEYFSDRVFGGLTSIEYPFSQYERIQLNADGFFVDRHYYAVPAGSGLHDVMPFNLRMELSAVRDNTLWKSTGPLRGTRSKIAVEYVPKIGENSLSYVGARADLRKYYHFGRGYGFAMRLAAGGVKGDNSPVFWLGGSENWLNWQSVRRDYFDIDRFYFSNFVLPMRGYPYFAFEGKYYGLMNLELRYPFVKRIDLGFPPITIGGINGAFFADFGGVAPENIREFKGATDGRLDDLKMSIGFGARSWIWWFLFYYDLAWSTDLGEISPKPTHHFGIGTEF
jgi:Tol biopolymer transport system component